VSKTVCYVNGQLLDSDQANISVFDHGFTVADGVFETLKFQSGQPFAVDRHIKRLRKSCDGLGIAFPDEGTLRNAIDSVSQANGDIAQGRMRITVTSGNGPLGSDRINISPTLVISVAAQKPWADSSEVLLVPWIKNEKSPLVGLKTTSYAENVYALEAAHEKGFSEAVFLSGQGLLSEGTGSNIFIVKNGEVLTPGTNSGLLEGITRELVLEWSTFPIFIKDLSEDDLFEADEVFITSSTRDVHPVTRIAKLTEAKRVVNLKELSVGKVTSEIAMTFKKLSNERINP
jgi:branched-chain amino acid aminotransferase